MAKKIRADELLLALGLAPTRSQAQSLIMAGRIFKSLDNPVKKAGELLPEGSVLFVSKGKTYVSRGGEKLKGALDDLEIDPSGLNCLDLGASTGGFTDCLLKSGAKSVTAVDVGRGLIHQSLVHDPRVTILEGVNARFLMDLDMEKDLKGPFDLATLDLSFISLELILPVTAPIMSENSKILAMVKPQFEVGRKDVGKGGVVRDQGLIDGAAEKIKTLAQKLNPPFVHTKSTPSRLKGPKGNQEIFVLMERV
jgi:23S rRNA (cytidine1920-2'-O)/16S rRNA (cytidine1409-2'-O)-methyltransferase